MLTFVLVAVAIATASSPRWRTGAPRRCAGSPLGRWRSGIPAQAVIGGITVLTDLNPWVVSFHLLVLDGDHRRLRGAASDDAATARRRPPRPAAASSARLG